MVEIINLLSMILQSMCEKNICYVLECLETHFGNVLKFVNTNVIYQCLRLDCLIPMKFLISGICALAKVLIASENNMIPANLWFKNPNKDIPGLLDGRLKVVSENTKWDGGLVAINNFGIGGTNAHLVLDTAAADRMVINTCS